MKDLYAQILAGQAAEVIKRSSGLEPKATWLKIGHQGPYELAVLIDFTGYGPDKRPLSGYISCGTALKEPLRPFLVSLSEYFGLDQSILDQTNGPRDMLGELLNIIVGLTAAIWSANSLVMDFGPPSDLSGRPCPPLKPSDDPHHFILEVPLARGGEVYMDFWAVFSD